MKKKWFIVRRCCVMMLRHDEASSNDSRTCFCSHSDGFQYSLDASTSLRQGAPMAYLNRGQFYALALSEAAFSSSLRQPRGRVRVSRPSRGPDDGRPSSREQCTMGGSELQRDSIVQVREGGQCRDTVEVDVFPTSLLLGSTEPCYT